MIHAPKNEKKIDIFYVWLSVDRTDGNEGIIAAPHPLVSSNLAFLQLMEPFVKIVTQDAGMDAKLVKFTHTEVIQTLKVTQ